MSKTEEMKIDLIGERFDRLEVKSFSHKEKRVSGKGYRYYYFCDCDCGNKNVLAERNSLKNKNTKSCGCIHSELLVKRNIESGSRNGDSKNEHEILYRIWCKVKHRCDSQNDKDYKHYGGRGITICKEWYEWNNFKEWALSNGYKDGLTIDRINTNGNYEPSNCRWVTMLIQANNKRNNKYLTYKDKTQSLADWCRELDLEYFRTKARLNTCNMSVEQAFELPKHPLKCEINKN